MRGNEKFETKPSLLDMCWAKYHVVGHSIVCGWFGDPNMTSRLEDLHGMRQDTANLSNYS